MKDSDLKRKLEVGPCFGTFVKLPRPEIIDILAIAGFDFVICDMEHAQISESEARSVIQACVAAELPVVVRLPEPTQGLVNRLLEAGADGIQMPRLRTAQESLELYRMMHFPPQGTRSVGNANRFAGYGTIPIPEYLVNENARVLTIGQFETQEIDHPCEPMFETLDVAFIGPMDLSVDFGVPGNFIDSTVQRRVAEIERAAANSGTIMGAFAGTVADVRRYLAAGYRYLAISGDISFLSKGAKSLMSSLRETYEEISSK
ncbi:aldolase/citrate lyase family protein [Neobacillus sp. 114]|uniref:HpcH/HpaI aldolase family protein n=1 Tax=Neobacillus sp. 114 TaxID=3048535 RepID=UPI0024C3211B|nr:aldolase/citrate lyase family protein [Neobacillus sp. 114]